MSLAITVPSVAVATTADGQHIARFGHDFPLVAIDAAGKRTVREAEGCCGSLARAVSDCDAVICTSIGRGAAGHLSQAGVRLLLVTEGTSLDAALTAYRAGKLMPGGEPTACDHGHEHGHEHSHDHGHHQSGGGCGCASTNVPQG